MGKIKDGWIKNCAENNIILMKLESSDVLELYKLTKEYEIDHNFAYEDPRFVVWEHDNYVVFRNYIDAYDYYSRRLECYGSK